MLRHALFWPSKLSILTHVRLYHGIRSRCLLRLEVTGRRAVPRKNLRPIPDPLLTMYEVAAWLRVHPNTIRRWTDSGSLKHFRVGERGDRRFSARDVRAFLGQRTSGSGQVPNTHQTPGNPQEAKEGLSLSVKDTALRLGVSSTTVRRWELQGKLKAVRIGSLEERRFNEDQIEEYLRGCRRSLGPELPSS